MQTPSSRSGLPPGWITEINGQKQAAPRWQWDAEPLFQHIEGPLDATRRPIDFVAGAPVGAKTLYLSANPARKRNGSDPNSRGAVGWRVFGERYGSRFVREFQTQIGETARVNVDGMFNCQVQITQAHNVLLDRPDPAVLPTETPKYEWNAQASFSPTPISPGGSFAWLLTRGVGVGTYAVPPGAVSVKLATAGVPGSLAFFWSCAGPDGSIVPVLEAPLTSFDIGPPTVRPVEGPWYTRSDPAAGPLDFLWKIDLT